MRYQDNSAPWKTKHWSKLWHSNITNIACLKSLTSQKGFVAIDAEPWGHDSTHIAEIGLSLIQPFELSSIQGPITTLEELQTQLSISTYSIKISARPQGKREHFVAQNNKTVQPDDLENALLDILRSFQDKLTPITKSQGPLPDNDSRASLVLVGFDLAFELGSLSSFYPKVLDCFSSWVDLQELVKDIAQLGKAENPSMRDSLTALGFGSVSTDVGSIWKKHTAAKDTIRIAALLASLSQRSIDQSVLPLNFTYRRKWAPRRGNARYNGTTKLFHNQRPKPLEMFPFTVKMNLRDATSPPKKFNESEMMELFAEYKPTAVATYVQGKVPGFVSLASFQELEDFIAEFDGKKCEEYGGSWTAVSFFDPALTPARTAEELQQWNEARQQEIILKKRENRQKKRQEQDIDD